MFGSSAVTSSAKWISSTLIEEAKYLYEVDDEIQNLQSELEHMQQHLQDADAKEALKQHTHTQLLIFTENIRKMAFRAEDALDHYIVDVSTKTSIKCFFKKVACLMLHAQSIHVLRKEVDDILEEAKQANERLERYKGKEPCLVASEASSSRPPIENYILLESEDQLRVVGINEDIERFAKQLTSDFGDSQVLAIVGEGGAGKSTLAAKLYCHPDVAQRFSCKAHISVSQQWSGSDLLSKIYKQCEGHEKNKVEAQEIKDFLKGVRYLIVLDDIWTPDAWDYVSPAFPPNKCSRIILTTRNRDLPSHVGGRPACTVQEPKKLTNEEKWELFSEIAIEGQPFVGSYDDEFKQLGEEMLERCDALPLTVVTLAGILRAKHHLHEWEIIKKALAERILEGKGNHGYGVDRDMIALSYDILPPHIKPCFLYLAIFPEDEVISIPKLISMWIAEGFVTEDQLRGEETLEDAARNVVDELARRSMVQISERDLSGKIQKFHMHDIVREFCIAKAKQQHFVEVVSLVDRNKAMEARRVSVHSGGKFSAENQHLRALVQFHREPMEAMKLDFIEKFKLLRVLSIWNVPELVLHEKIGTLIHLRYIHIFCWEGVKIPDSVRNLRNLIYFDCSVVRSAPDNIFGQMEKLRHACLVVERMSLKRLGVGNLKKLQSLSVEAGEWMVEELPKLDSPIQHLGLSFITRKEEIEAVFECPSVKKDRISSLQIVITSSEQNLLDLRKLEHCKALCCLNLDGDIEQNGRVLRFPSNLVELTLRYSRVKEDKDDDLMEAIARLSKLRSLTLDNRSYVGRQLTFKAKYALQKLNKLSLEALTYLEEWKIEEGAMPCINKIKIRWCEKLKSLPENLGSIATLKELVIERMPEKFCRRYGYGEPQGEDTCIIQHIPSVRFKYIYQKR